MRIKKVFFEIPGMERKGGAREACGKSLSYTRREEERARVRNLRWMDFSSPRGIERSTEGREGMELLSLAPP